jgi:hypothetical protein
MDTKTRHEFAQVIDDICRLGWSGLSRDELKAVASAYHYFSQHFCQSVDLACGLYPADARLKELREGECDTDNLSPYPGVAERGEKMNHDEFMRRTVAMCRMDKVTEDRINRLGAAYLAEARQVSPAIRALSLASYESGGLERVFTAVLHAKDWSDPGLLAFRHFLEGHIKLDSDPDHGHGSLCRHLVPDDRILPLWAAFRKLLIDAAASLKH